MFRWRKQLGLWASAVVLLCGLTGIASQEPRGTGATIWYLGHCVFAVRTSGHLLLWDYHEKREGQQPKVRPARPSLADGWIHPGEIKDSKVRIFVSHSHEDHYDPIILAWKKIIPDIVYYFGWKASDGSAHHYLVGAEAELATGSLEIATINSHHSGVPEVAWLVKVDGLVVYHNGDCQPDDPASAHDFLRKKTGHIDIAFVFPVYEDGQKYTKDVIIYPDHVDGGSWREEGHSVAPSDLLEVLESLPAALVIGQGSPGRMEVPDDTRRKVEAGGTELIVQPMAGAVATYNSLRKIRRAAAALHLTC